MKDADVFIGGDTGPMHIAAACQLMGLLFRVIPKMEILIMGIALNDLAHGNRR